MLFLFFITSITLAQKKEGIIHFKDGTEKHGYIKYGPSPFASNILVTDKVKFRKTIKSKEIIDYEFSKISKIDLIRNGEILWSSYFKIPKKNPDIILEVNLVHKGITSLYTHMASVNNPSNYGGGSITEYYVQNNEEGIVKIFPGKPFGVSSEKLMKQFFKDCPKLVELIEKEAFKRYVANTPKLAKRKTKNRLIEIVKFYNSKCNVGN